MILQILNNKYFKYILILILIAFFGIVYLIYNKGYSAGVLEEQHKNQKAIIKLLKQKEIEQAKAIEEAKKTVEKEVQIVTKYKDRVIEVEKIVNNIEYKNCKMNDTDFKDYKKLLEEIK